MSLSPLWCISEVIGALYVDAAFRNNSVVKLSFVLLLVGSCFSPPACVTVTKRATSEDRTHDFKIMWLTRCRLRHCRCLLWCISEVIGALYVDAAFRSNTVVWLYSVLLLVGSGFSPPVCITVTKSSTSEDRTHDLKIMRLTRCRLRHCRCLRYGASVKLLEPCTLMRHSGVTLLSGYILCCFWLVLVFRLQYVLPLQKVRQVRIELTTLRLWDLRAAHCASVAVSVMVHQWSYWSLVRWCGIPE